MLKEFDRQLNNLVQKGYPQAAGMSVEQFLKYIQPLRETILTLALPEVVLEMGCLPFVIVIGSDWVTTEQAMALAEREGKTGFINMYPVEPRSFKPIDGVLIPCEKAYLLLNIDRGKDTLNMTPDDALKIINKRVRSPLTIDEGVAIITQHPDFLKKNNCFSLLGSRRGDRRVPALWISEGRPRLGWCWAGNPHTWLGSASCSGRTC
jgi:hypothetical protein